MPEYEYTCTECGRQFEVRKPISQAAEDEQCPSCGGETKRKWSATNISSSSCGTSYGAPVRFG